MKFLTSQRPGSLDACNIWVELSDKEHCILARLTEEAMRRYKEDPIFGGKPVAEHRSALVVIKAFRPCFGRVPSHDGKGMTPERYLFLDVDQFQLKGGFGEERWGSPADIANDPNIREWLQGLRQDGGGFSYQNVLKLRKQAQIQSAGEDADGLGKKKVSMRCMAQRQFKPFPTDAPFARKPVSRKLDTDHKADAPVSEIVPAKTSGRKGRQRSWRFIRSMPMAFVEPPMDVLDRLRELSVDRPDDTEHLAGPSKIVVEPSNNIAKPKSRPKRNPLDLSSSPAASPRINRLSSSPDAAILSPRLPGTPSECDTDDVSHSVPRVETQRKDELDSDDARTKRQVDRYLSHSQLAPLESQTSQSGHPPNAYSPEHRRSSTRAADVQGESSGGPVLPHSPDVFTDEDSFRQSDVDVGLSPKVQANSRPADSSSARPAEGSAVLKPAPLQNGGVSGGVPANGDRPQTKSVDRLTNHDAKAWAAPAFMRSERNGMDKGKTQALEPEVFKPLGAKRRNSSPLSPEQPIKRRKVTSESSTIAHAPTIAGVSKLHDAQAAKSTDTVLPPKESNGRGVVKIPHIDLRRSGSISSSSSKKRMKPGGSGLQSTNSKPEIHVVKTISSQGLPYEVKHVDFHGGLLSSKYSHARKSKERQLQDRLVQSTEDTPNHVAPQRPAVTPSTSHLGSVKPIPTMDRHKAESSSRGPRVPATGAALARQNASQSSAPLLGVRQPTFGMAREEEGPPLVTWDGMMRILMRTGQMRNKQLRQGG
ncbi:hypothetical protein A0H81_09085 [Grifola frondosa]|uniref:Telomere replication protein EST3 n=1 Tax=Grifola frondosa TaxID=5627 RepID=A0A1C7M1T0_GRIFR|nr:hypothetical protein A0H81_09085 [Grifola frondosa]